MGHGRGFNPHFEIYPTGEIYLIHGLARLAQRTSGAEWRIETIEGRAAWHHTGRLASAALPCCIEFTERFRNSMC